MISMETIKVENDQKAECFKPLLFHYLQKCLLVCKCRQQQKLKGKSYCQRQQDMKM